MRSGEIIRISAPVFSLSLVLRVAIVFILRENRVENWIESCVSLVDAILEVWLSIEGCIYIGGDWLSMLRS